MNIVVSAPHKDKALLVRFDDERIELHLQFMDRRSDRHRDAGCDAGQGKFQPAVARGVCDKHLFRARQVTV